MSGFVPDRSATLRAAIRDGKAMRGARDKRRALAERMRRPARQPTPEEIAAVQLDEPEGGYQFPEKGHWQ